MDNSIDNFWKIRLQDVKQALENNNFEVFIADNAQQAKDMVLNDIIPKLKPETISWGGSMTFIDSGIYNEIMAQKDISIIDTTAKDAAHEEKLERRRQALLVDLFFTGTNAITENGYLVNLDMIGNRVAALTFGPKNVVVLAGRNKIVPDLEDAMVRIKNYAAPANVMRLDMKTPCIKTGRCQDCKSSGRICNNWTINEKSFPKGRTKVILINQDMGI
ncbi:LUD domain-containing protein [Desulfonema limicola]|uniref:LUD domain-containing protein n=1 Tax=Desulfonema limicola TaxID=45656 RepID=A0A975GHT7_9BACT|nr:lactate utilization protein [Desulfonema limicola]QTA81058.1 LUD domain-containing protein [Desulfonema limicola]